jgi:hypothetical protein
MLKSEFYAPIWKCEIRLRQVQKDRCHCYSFYTQFYRAAMPPADSNVYLASTACSALIISENFEKQPRVSINFMKKNVFRCICFGFGVYFISVDSSWEYTFNSQDLPFYSHCYCSVKGFSDRDSNPGSALQQQGALTIELKTLFQFSKPALMLLGLMYVGGTSTV